LVGAFFFDRMIDRDLQGGGPDLPVPFYLQQQAFHQRKALGHIQAVQGTVSAS